MTKRMLGLLLLLLGMLGLVAVLGVDLLDAGREGGIGPAQRLALGACVALAVLGLTLIPLGSDLA